MLHSKNNTKSPKIALAHDFLIYQGGAERVFTEIASLFPEAPIFTLLSKVAITKDFGPERITTSFLKKLSSIVPHHWMLPLYPIAAESIDLRDYDLVISSTSSFMKGLVVKPKTIHICYCHTPTRYLWDMNEQYLNSRIEEGVFIYPKRFLARAMLNYLRMWDQTAAKRVDYFIANSNFTAKRIKKYYKKKSQVIYPPVDTEKFHQASKFFQKKWTHSPKNKYFLVVSRLSSYKRIDLVVEAFNRLGWPLIIAGDGTERKNLQKIARPNIRFLGFVKEKFLPKLYARSRALVFPGEDDFGITMVEAMASGKPVLAYRSGGALEIVEEGKTGEFYNAPEVEVLVDGLRRLTENEDNYNPKYIQESARRFSQEEFRKNFTKTIEELINKKEDLE